MNPTPARTASAPVLWFYAMLAGLLAAAATTGFRAAIVGVQWLGTGQLGSSLVEAARHVPPWQRVAIGAVGGLLAGLVLEWGARWAARGLQGARHIDYLDAARTRTVDLNDRTTWVRSVSALLSVGSGASIGREGPMIQLAAWLSAKLAHFALLSTEQRTVILICGVSSPRSRMRR